MTRKSAYIAGPIQGYEGKQEYRDRLGQILSDAGFDIIDPWKRESIIYTSEDESLTREELAGFIARDLEDIDRCDLFVAYLPLLSAGTCMELFHAKRLGKSTVVITDMIELSPWIVFHSDDILRSFDELNDYLEEDA